MGASPYKPIEGCFDEMAGRSDAVREAYREVETWLADSDPAVLEQRRREAELLFMRIGITFAVYGEGGDPERIIPFDIVPRVIDAREWERLSRGLEQRVKALNLFLCDIYADREIIKAGVIDEALVLRNPAYLPEMNGLKPAGGVFAHIAGIDMVRVGEDEFYVLEDNARTPSGVSYMLEDREIMMRLFPDLMAAHDIAPVEHYPSELLATLQSVAPRDGDPDPTVVVLTPGIYNSAYYEHTYLADRMGVELVEGQDLFVDENRVFMRTTRGPEQVDVIYKRIDNPFIDPLVFNPNSALGVPGLMTALRAGNVTLANAPGAGVADDKSVYVHVPDMIKFYLGEEAILKNVPTYRCGEVDDCKYVMENLGELVVKEVRGSGGYGMLVGPHSTKVEQQEYAKRIMATPDEFIAQPTLALSTCPTFVDSGVAPRHVDLRPFVLTGANGVTIVPGGLTRVALREGSLVVNSSQGGGTKDTWVLRPGYGAPEGSSC
jgi:uncharacterized circularly permuted ATP-grasp superfamily protein